MCMRVVRWMNAQAERSVSGVKGFPVRERDRICMRFLLSLQCERVCVSARTKSIYGRSIVSADKMRVRQGCLGEVQIYSVLIIIEII